MAELPGKLWVIVRRGLQDSEVIELHVSHEAAVERARAIKAEDALPGNAVYVGEALYVVEAPLIQPK